MCIGDGNQWNQCNPWSLGTRETIRTLWSSDRKARAHIFRRADGTYGFFEERISNDPYEANCWIPYFGETESYCATEDIALREVLARIPWLAEMIATFREIDGLPTPNPADPPIAINDAKVICVTILDRRHRYTGNCLQLRDGHALFPPYGLAICKYDEDDGYYLFACDDEWRVQSDTYHASIDEARAQAEFEYCGTSSTWRSIDG